MKRFEITPLHDEEWVIVYDHALDYPFVFYNHENAVAWLENNYSTKWAELEQKEGPEFVEAEGFFLTFTPYDPMPEV